MLRFYKKEDINRILEIIDIVGDTYVPTISERVGTFGYFEYIQGRNPEYIRDKYGDVSLPEKPRTIVYLNDSGIIAGFLSYFEYFEPYNNAYFATIMVDERYRRQGVGTNLINEMLNDLKGKGIDSLKVTTWSTNEASRGLLIKSGFKLLESIIDEREKGVDGLYLEYKFK